MCRRSLCGCRFFFNDTATTEIYTLSLHDALPICRRRVLARNALVHHEDGVVSTVSARLDVGIQRVALPSPIDDVAIAVTPGRQLHDLFPDSTDGFHLASVQGPVVDVAR